LKSLNYVTYIIWVSYTIKKRAFLIENALRSESLLVRRLICFYIFILIYEVSGLYPLDVSFIFQKNNFNYFNGHCRIYF
jgi:hypothetical protein